MNIFIQYYRLLIITLILLYNNSLSQLANTPWPMFLHDVRHTGQSAFNCPDEIELLWIYQTMDEVTSSPSIGSDGTIYFCAYDDNKSKLIAVYPSGNRKWEYILNSSFGTQSTPCIGSDNTIYLGDSKYILAINSDGELKWETRLSNTWEDVNSSPVLGKDGTIYIGANTDSLYALHSDGTFKWKYGTAGDVASSPAIDNEGNIYFGSDDGYIYCIKTNGVLKWKYHKGGDVSVGDSSPAINTDGTIYVGSDDGNLYAMNPDGSVKWTHYITWGWIDSSPAIYNNNTIILRYLYDLYAININGDPKWHYEIGIASHYHNTCLAIDGNGTIYVSNPQKFVAVNNTGKLKWDYEPTSDISTSPCIDSYGHIYFGTKNGLHCLGMPIGSEVPDLVISDILVEPHSNSAVGANVKITAIIDELTDIAPAHCDVSFYYDNTSNFIGTDQTYIPNSGLGYPYVNWSTQNFEPGEYTIIIRIVNTVPAESNANNNELHLNYTLLPADADKPTAITQTVSNIDSMRATLNGLVNPYGLESIVKFEYGTTTSYGNEVTAAQSPVIGSSSVPVNAQLSSLSPNTTYHFRVVATNSLGTTYGDDESFTTLQTGSVPTVTANNATNVSTALSTLNAVVNPNGLSTTVKFEYGMTTSYGSEKVATQSPVSGSSSVSVSAQLTNLSANTTYHYRAVATNSAGTTYGDDLTFTTLQSGSAPTVATNSATNVSATSSTLNGTVNPNGLSTTVRFEYGTSTDYGSEVTATQSPVSGTNSVSVSVPLSGLSSNTTYHYRIAATNSAGTTHGNDQSFSTTQSSDTQAPFISHSAPSSAPYNQSITITSTITDNTGVSSVKLFYRKGGDDAFTSVDMSGTGGDAYQGSMASNIATERGVEYYIEAKDNSNNTSYHPASNPTTAPHGISITFSGLTCPNSTPTNSYRMISTPFNMNSITPESVLEDDFGSYDNTKWRLIRWQSGGYQEYTVNNIESFNPGNAFWLITKEPGSWDAGPGQSITTSNNYTITLQPGWNQIGNPFAFSVDWDDVILSGNIEAPVGYEGQGNEPAGYQYNQPRIDPWKGYCVNNLESRSVTIEIPPVESSDLSKNIRSPELLADEAGEWLIQIKASCESVIDLENYFGCLKNAEDCWDKHEFSEAPPIGKSISLYFPNTEWKQYPGHYTTDFRSTSTDEQAWLFKVVTHIANGKINLHFVKSGRLPEGREVILIDQSTKLKTDLLSQNNLEYFSNAGGSERAFAILYGSRGFIDDYMRAIIEIPETYQLYQNSPNPFNSTTRIRYSLPAYSQTTVEIYNNIGIKIRTLTDHVFLEKGVHVLFWDGKNDGNHPVGSGIYYLFLTTDQFKKSIKMLLLR